MTTFVTEEPAWIVTHRAGSIGARVVTRHFSRGHFEEDGELWDEAGNLVAVSRQRAMLLTR